MLPRVTIITVVRHDLRGLELTASSVLSQNLSAVEWMIVDGGEDVATASFCESLTTRPGMSLRVIREIDSGIYDAMNKGISLAEGDWLVFMNAGDRFDDSSSLVRAMAFAGNDVDVIYSDVIFERGGKKERIHCDLDRRRFHHQSIVYRKSLHEKHGKYVVAPGVTISDYLFFNCVSHLRWAKSSDPIAVCDTTGQSSKPRAYYQKLAVDLIFGHKAAWTVGIMLIAYPFYRILIRPLIRIVKVALTWTGR